MKARATKFANLDRNATVWALLAVLLHPVLGERFIHQKLQCAFPIPLLHCLFPRWSCWQVFISDSPLFTCIPHSHAYFYVIEFPTNITRENCSTAILQLSKPRERGVVIWICLIFLPVDYDALTVLLTMTRFLKCATATSPCTNERTLRIALFKCNLL